MAAIFNFKTFNSDAFFYILANSILDTIIEDQASTRLIVRVFLIAVVWSVEFVIFSASYKIISYLATSFEPFVYSAVEEYLNRRYDTPLGAAIALFAVFGVLAHLVLRLLEASIRTTTRLNLSWATRQAQGQRQPIAAQRKRHPTREQSRLEDVDVQSNQRPYL